MVVLSIQMVGAYVELTTFGASGAILILC